MKARSDFEIAAEIIPDEELIASQSKIAVTESGDYLLGFDHGEHWRSEPWTEESLPPEEGAYTPEELMDLLLTDNAPRPTYPEAYAQGVIDGYKGDTSTRDRLEQQGELFDQPEMLGM